jgi:hypothetical protein
MSTPAALKLKIKKEIDALTPEEGSRTLVIGNIEASVTEVHLRQLFECMVRPATLNFEGTFACRQLLPSEEVVRGHSCHSHPGTGRHREDKHRRW